MKKINFRIRFFLDKKIGRVMCRVRWNHSLCEVVFSTGVYAQEEKWNKDLQKAKIRTEHVVLGKRFPAADINERIEEYRETIESCFAYFILKNQVPSKDEVRDMVNESLGRKKKVVVRQFKMSLTLNMLYEKFISTRGRQRNWNQIAIEKYNQALLHLTSANPNVTVESISLDTMYKLRDWYIRKGYRNRTVNRQMTMLKSFLKWVSLQNGIAGLDRIVVDTYYVGTKRFRKTHRFYEIISCHTARRTFVSCSLAMGIPPEVVMKATGHRDYKTMKPYIATSDETQAREMNKWNQQQYLKNLYFHIPKIQERVSHLH